ncbi:uncharacterized protein JCM15063_005295 [Sporobolomyces koalae]|uniref:uncharacterized protein n=1 Tax=Sporobolomyces koalae TaxID=500713 RepID=UPI00317147C8
MCDNSAMTTIPGPASIPRPQLLAQSLVLSRLSTSPTVLPPNLANLVTALSLAARVSLRTSALFLEAILEGLQGTTVASLGLTRRFLIAAVGSARNLHYVRGGLDWSGRDEAGNKTEDAFLTVLDKYTNLGIYLIHHTFTLAELFTMSSFYLTLNTVHTISTAAEESVRTLDSILGSNESSRALSSIITLVRHELTHQDPDSELAQRGTLASIAAMTKAITAFACLQTATHRRTLKELKLRVIYDCTVVVDHENPRESSGWNRDEGQEAIYGRYAGPRPARSTPRTPRERKISVPSSLDHEMPRDELDEAVLTDVRAEYERQIGTTVQNQRSRTTSLYDNRPAAEGTFDATEMEYLQEGLLENGFQVPGEQEIVDELNELVGLPEITTSTDRTNGGETEQDHEILYDATELDATDLPEEVRTALRQLELEDLQVGTTVVRSRATRGYSYEIEVQETTTTTTTTIRTVEEVPGKRKSTVLSRQTRDKEPTGDPYGNSDDEQDDWIAVGAQSLRDEQMEVDEPDYPTVGNGLQESVAVKSRKEALEEPIENRQRLQVVLSTMTKQFTQRKRTVRRVSDSREPSPSLPSPAVSSPATSPKIGWSRSSRDPVEALRSHNAAVPGAQAPGRPNSVFNTLSKPFSRHPPASLETSVTPEAASPEIQAKPDPRTASANPLGPLVTPATNFKKHERSISASTLSPPSAKQPPADLPPQPSLLPIDTTASARPASGRSAVARTSSSSPSVSTVTPRAVEDEAEPKEDNFPRRHLVSNLQHFARYSSAAYGQSFLRILGLAKSEFKFPHTEIHANNHSFAHHVGIHVDDILLSSFTDPRSDLNNDKISPIVNYVAVDHSLEAIVLSCRGSLGLSDILVDLTCDYEPIPVPEADPRGSYLVHSGMFLSATTLQRGTVHDVIRDALSRFPTYGLVLCGHSLGGGVAALLSILWAIPSVAFQRIEAEIVLERRVPPAHPPFSSTFVTSYASGLPPGRPIACYTYGVPCVASPDLAQYAHGLIISTVHNYDIVPTLSIGTLRDLKTMAMGFYAETGVAEEIVGRVVGLCQRRFMAKRAAARTMPVPAYLPPGISRGDEEDERMTPESLTDPSEESRLVPLTDRELMLGKSANKALEPSYTDPSLLGADLADDVDLSEWLWSLRKTIRASSDSEKLYPPGRVYIVENYTVFISGESSDGRYSRKEGRRVLLRAVDDVERRFSEPIFSRSMLSDHSPKSYETNCDLLAAATL